MTGLALAAMTGAVALVAAAVHFARLRSRFSVIVVATACLPGAALLIGGGSTTASFAAGPGFAAHEAGRPLVLSRDTLAAIEASTLSITAHGCDQVASGTGFVAQERLIVTSAHVVAAADSVTATTTDGETLPAEIVAFDPDLDVALLAVPELVAPPLPLSGPTGDPRVVVLGYPQGAGLRALDALVRERIVALGADIYDEGEVRRDVLVLDARLDPGESGSPVVDPEGSVVAMAFAIDASDPTTAYALVASAVELAASYGEGPVETGPCLPG